MTCTGPEHCVAICSFREDCALKEQRHDERQAWQLRLPFNQPRTEDECDIDPENPDDDPAL